MRLLSVYPPDDAADDEGRKAGGNVDARLHLRSMSSQWMQEKSSIIIIVVIS